MSKRVLLCLLIFGVPIVVSGGHPNLCNWMGPEGLHDFLSVSEDIGGFQIRSAERYDVVKLRNMPRFRRALANDTLPPRLSYWPVAEFLATRASATVIYVGEAASYNGETAAPIPLGKTWRGATPLACLRAFAEDAGLKVVVPEEGWWIIGPGKDVETTAVVVTAYPFDEDQVPLGRGTLRAVLRTLPVRNWAMSMGDEQPVIVPLALGYYRVPEEAGRYIFVVTHDSESFGAINAETGIGPRGMTFKVEIEGAGRDALVTCLWGTPGVGDLATEFAEDLDGDGFRDFLFLEEDRRALKPVIGDYNFVLSGADGRGLVSYHHSGTLAVERRADGPKRIAVEGLYGTGFGDLDKVVVLDYDTEHQKYVPEAELKAEGSAEAEAAGLRPPRTGAAEALAATLGGPEHVVEYDLSTWDPPPDPREQIAHYEKTGTLLQRHISLWHLCAWNTGGSTRFWRRILVEGIPSPGEVLITHIPEGYKRAYLEYLKAMHLTRAMVALPGELRPRDAE